MREIVAGLSFGVVMATVLLAAAPGSLIWEARPGFRDFGAMIESEGLVVTGNITGEGGVFAFDATTGAPRWRFRGGQMLGYPVTDGEAVFVVTSVPDRRLVALGLKTGKMLWSVAEERIGNDFGPLVEGGKVYLVSRNGKVNAYEARTGKPVWEFAYSPLKGECSTGLALSGNRLFFGGGDEPRPHSEGKSLWALDASTGRMLWRYRATISPTDEDGQCVSTPAVSGGLLVSTAAHTVFALDAVSGAPRWKKTVERMVRGDMKPRVLSQVLIANGAVYCYFPEGLTSWSLSNGAPLMELPGRFPDSNYNVRLAEFDGVLYFVGGLPSDGESAASSPLHAFDLNTRRVLWTHRVTAGSWSTNYLLPTPSGVYYENEKVLAKVAR
uniref:Outer membrane assembly lipoprotein YfgL n=1 Tax=uncultured bacterium CSLF43 TaxID=1091575 RepID=G4WW15_9BACT|nr:outer membrane assembly lipoprotein YfgL [uncultured bacterium CSLF43]